MPEDEIQNKLLLEIEELMSLLAQQTDKRSTNLQLQIEGCKDEVDRQVKKKWHWFLGIVGTVVVSFGVLAIEMWERYYDRVSNVEKSISIIEKRQERILDKMITYSELRSESVQVRREMEKHVKEEIDKVENKLEKVKDKIEQLHPRRSK